VWNLDVGPKTEWPVHLDAGWSSAQQKEEVLETYAGLYFNNSEPANQGATFMVSNPAGPNPPSVVSSTDFSNTSLIFLTDPDGYGTGTYPVTGQEGYLKYYKEYDVADSFRLYAKHELDASIFKDVEVGVSVSQRFKQFGQDVSDYVLNASGKSTAPLPPVVGTTNLSFIGNLHPPAFDANAALASGALIAVANPNPANYEGDDYDVWETVTRPFVKFDLKGDLGGVPFEGNLGAVVDCTSQNSTGVSGNLAGGETVLPVSAGASTNR
jgi:iron complex outermembrane receptor protein